MHFFLPVTTIAPLSSLIESLRWPVTSENTITHYTLCTESTPLAYHFMRIILHVRNCSHYLSDLDHFSLFFPDRDCRLTCFKPFCFAYLLLVHGVGVCKSSILDLKEGRYVYQATRPLKKKKNNYYYIIISAPPFRKFEKELRTFTD